MFRYRLNRNGMRNTTACAAFRRGKLRECGPCVTYHIARAGARRRGGLGQARRERTEAARPSRTAAVVSMFKQASVTLWP
jgi:hypothetical protein